MSTDNPFSAPVADTTFPSETPRNSQSPDSFFESAKRIFFAWEKLRLVYIFILGVESLLIGYPQSPNLEFFSALVFGCIVSNMCFFLGPIVETYVTWLGYRGKWLRTVLFLLGLIFTGTVAAVMLINYAAWFPPAS